MGRKKELSDEELVLNHIDRYNRPYNVADICGALSTIKKTAVLQALKTLSEKGRIRVKVYGKSYIYGPVHPEEEPEEEVESLEEEVVQGRREVRELTAALAEIESTPTDGQLDEEMQEMEREIEEMQIELEKMQGDRKEVDPKEKENLNRQKSKAAKIEGARKRKCMEILDGVSEGLEIPKKTLIELAGIEFPK
jgi:ATPase subunit of ABC transporter with duplicated ATPase domains